MREGEKVREYLCKLEGATGVEEEPTNIKCSESATVKNETHYFA